MSQSSPRAASASATAQLPDPSLAPPALSNAEAGFTAQDLINRQLQLEREAHEACPFGVSRCTHASGPARQLVFSCRTCAEQGQDGPRGVCAACSVACHAEHDLVELFHRRNFRCDCGTTKAGKDQDKVQPCTLREPPYAVENEGNRYDHNFDGAFCYCERGQTYNPHEEKETMFQCLICEDWLHESCTSLKRSGKEGGSDADETPVLLDHELFEHLICDACVRTHKTALLPYSGTRGWLFCLPERVPANMLNASLKKEDTKSTWDDQPVRTFHDGMESWRVFGLPAGTLTSDEAAASAAMGTESLSAPAAANADETSNTVVISSAQASITDSSSSPTASSSNGKKRALSPEVATATDGSNEGAGPSKRVKLQDGDAPASTVPTAPAEAACRRPPDGGLLRDIDQLPEDVRLDLFLMPTFRERICRCDKCLPIWSALPFVLHEEPTLSPPPTSTPSESGSTYSLGLAALQHLPRERMLTALSHYQDFRARLFELLQPFAESGQTVDEETIRAFTARLMQRDEAAPSSSST
ncbi:hypothetical protein OC842_002890 [Tilletia horrida]|uniref:UBR-type domain-containing protein n=1 Tax=Tilletia horrida TaxID=155126 RepID=A0AAN6GCS0_9BASI|nr:hypothetical protein OC842_002890 [Tilletia horrida]